MCRFIRIFAFSATLLLLVGLLAACGGGDGEDEADPTGTAVSEPTAPPSGALPFESFHQTVDIEFTISAPGEDDATFGLSVEGDFVAPDSHAFQQSVEFAGIRISEEFVIMGDDAWLRQGSGTWTATTLSDPDVQDAIDLTSADPEFLFPEDLAGNLSALDSEPETINGVDTQRYFIPKEAIETLADLLGEEFLGDSAGIEEFEMTVWLEEDTGALVRAEFTGRAAPDLLGEEAPFDLAPDATVTLSMVINVSQINDPSIEIEPPI